MKNEEYINSKENVISEEIEKNETSPVSPQTHFENAGEPVSVNLFGEVEEIENEKSIFDEIAEHELDFVDPIPSPSLSNDSTLITQDGEDTSETLTLGDSTLEYDENNFEGDEKSEEDDEENGAETDESDEENENSDDGHTNSVEKSSENEENEPREKPRRVDAIFDFIEIAVFTLASVFILLSFFFRYSLVDGDSMMNTLHDNERLIITDFLYTPECGDIVVVQDKSTVLKDPIVKRIIAVGGQKVKFTRTDVYVDGVKLDEPYVYTGDYVSPFGTKDEYRYSVYPSDELIDLVVDSVDGVYYEILVPEGEIFVMGDHRNKSKDSRDIGTLHEDAIIGKAIFRFFPFDKYGKIE